MKQTTEQLVRKCFCNGCENDGEDLEHCPVICVAFDYTRVARAARRFVAMENRGKMRLLKLVNVDYEKRKLPKHWGKLKVNNKWVKF